MIAILAEVARESAGAGALIASLPLVSILTMIWLEAIPGTSHHGDRSSRNHAQKAKHPAISAKADQR